MSEKKLLERAMPWLRARVTIQVHNRVRWTGGFHGCIWVVWFAMEFACHDDYGLRRWEMVRFTVTLLNFDFKFYVTKAQDKLTWGIHA